MDIVQEMLTTFNDDPDLFVLLCTADQPRPKKTYEVHLNVKILLTVVFDWNDVLYHEFGRTVNREYYLEVMSRLRQVIS